MLREPKKAVQGEQPVVGRKDKQTGRFQIVKLEERIAPKAGGPGKGPCAPAADIVHNQNTHCE